MTTIPERLARLEAQVDHMRESQDRAEAKLDSVVEAITTARGGWRVVAIVGPLLSGLFGFAASKLGIPKV